MADMLAQTAVFTRSVRDHMGPPPLLVAAADSCRRVVERLRSAGASQAVVSDGVGRALGIVTEQDVARRIACSDRDEAPIESVMSSPVVSICATDLLYHAIAWMHKHGLRHMPVVDEAEKVVGVLQLHQAMAVAAAPMLRHIAALSNDDDLRGMKATKDAQVQVALELMDDALPAPQIQTLLSRINNNLYGSVLRF